MKDKCFEWIRKCLVSIEGNRELTAIRKGFMLVIPIVIAGSIALLLNNIPISIFQYLFKEFANGMISHVLVNIYYSTQGMIALYLVLSISFYYSIGLGVTNNSLRIIIMFTSFVCFCASFGMIDSSFSISNFGGIGIFTAMLTSLIAPRLFLYFLHFLIPLKSIMRENENGEYFLSYFAIIPILGCAIVFILANVLMVKLWNVTDFNQLISNILLSIFKSTESELLSGVLYVLFVNLLWCFGIHGGNALDAVANDIFTNNNQILTKGFIDNFVMMGGCGSALCLVIAIMMISKNVRSKGIAISTLPMTIFNINETIVFGLPVVLNPFLFIPFIFVPIFNLIISYFVVNLGNISIKFSDTLTWTTPPLISGYMITDSMIGAFLQGACILFGVGCYVPFVYLYEKMQRSQHIDLINNLTVDYKKTEKIITNYSKRGDLLGHTASQLISELARDIKDKKINLFYQPQVDDKGNVVGGEALLRWQSGGTVVYPPLVIALAKESKQFNKLTKVIVENVCNHINQMKENGVEKPHISINISAMQLDNTVFLENLISIILDKNVSKNVSLELTEESSLSSLTHVQDNIQLLNGYGIECYIDDFSMGQTSIKYLESNSFSTVKLDGQIVKQIEYNIRSREIVASIVKLCDTLHINVIAEYVESREIRDILLSIGCKTYQGYLYSPAVTVEEYITFVKENHK